MFKLILEFCFIYLLYVRDWIINVLVDIVWIFNIIVWKSMLFLVDIDKL